MYSSAPILQGTDPGTPFKVAATWPRPEASKSARTATRHPALAMRAIALISAADGVPSVHSRRMLSPLPARSAAAEAIDGFSVTKTQAPAAFGVGHAHRCNS